MRNTQLSPREMTVLRYLAWGYTNAEIAKRLNLSVKTVEAHKANAMRKLKLGNRAALVGYAVDHGWMMRESSPDDGQQLSETSEQELKLA